MKLYIIVALLSALILGGGSHFVRNGWQGWQENKLKEAQVTELLADQAKVIDIYLQQMMLKDESIAILEQENKWAVRHVANREEQIAELREGFSDEVNLCLDVVRTETAKVYVSEQDKHPTQVPIKAVEPLTITDALRRGREMRAQFCNLYSEYIEMLRNATYGEIILDRPTEDRCPTSD